jgi:L-threonylcarbamoyladenylate synthase
MKATILKLDPRADGRAAIQEAADCLSQGGLVVFPTETVYGVGADATNPAAVARLRSVKQRWEEKPFTVHVGSRNAVERFVPELTGWPAGWWTRPGRGP